MSRDDCSFFSQKYVDTISSFHYKNEVVKFWCVLSGVRGSTQIESQKKKWGNLVLLSQNLESFSHLKLLLAVSISSKINPSSWYFTLPFSIKPISLFIQISVSQEWQKFGLNIFITTDANKWKIQGEGMECFSKNYGKGAHDFV